MTYLNVFSYTIKFRAHDADNLNIMPFTPGEREEMPEHLDYDHVLQRSIEEGQIEKEADIKSLQDESHHHEAFFFSLPAKEIAQLTVEDAGMPFFDAEEQEVFYDQSFCDEAERAVKGAVELVNPVIGISDPEGYAESMWENRTEHEEYRDARGWVTIDDYVDWIKEKINQ